jgi:hypothetical protein
MEKKNYRYWSYLIMSLQRGYKDTIKYYTNDWKNSISNIIIAIAVPFYLVVGGKMNLSDFFPLLATSVGGTFAWSFIVFLAHILGAPTRLYREKEVELANLSWNDIEIKPYVFPKGSRFGVGLLIHNKKPIPLEKICARITAVKEGRKRIWEERALFEIPWVEYDELIWTEKQVCAGDSGIVAVANHDGEKAYLETSFPDIFVPILKTDTSYYVTIEFFGMVNGIYAPPPYPKFYGEIIYTEGEILLRDGNENIYSKNRR